MSIDENTQWQVYSDNDRRIRRMAFDLYINALKTIVAFSFAGIAANVGVLKFFENF